MPYVGATDLVELTVDPFDNTTTATVTVKDPDGTITSPAAAPGTDHSLWAASVTWDQPGEWRALWTVTGLGAGVIEQVIRVSPAGGPTGPTRVYATTADLARYLDAPPPAGAGKMLRGATILVEQLTATAVYAVDDAGLPTDAAVAAAFRDAICEQVNWWSVTGDPDGARALYGSVSIGSVTLGGRVTGAASQSPGRYGPQTLVILGQAGLLNQSPLVL